MLLFNFNDGETQMWQGTEKGRKYEYMGIFSSFFPFKVLFRKNWLNAPAGLEPTSPGL